MMKCEPRNIVANLESLQLITNLIRAISVLLWTIQYCDVHVRYLFIGLEYAWRNRKLPIVRATASKDDKKLLVMGRLLAACLFQSDNQQVQSLMKFCWRNDGNIKTRPPKAFISRLTIQMYLKVYDTIDLLLSFF
jgi:hypothetical protein